MSDIIYRKFLILHIQIIQILLLLLLFIVSVKYSDCFSSKLTHQRKLGYVCYYTLFLNLFIKFSRNFYNIGSGNSSTLH